MSTVARSRATDKRYYGVVEAIVVDVNDPAKEGRVKVKYPWFDADMVSDWSRVSQFYAGNGYGAFWLPEKGDEVAVAFVHGDMRLAIILGGLYNGQDVPATNRSDDRDEKMIRTKAGHQILLVDTQGKETIQFLEKGGKHSIEISTTDNAITISSSGGKIVLKAKEIEVNADATITIKAGGDMKLQGSTINLN
jgi:phage baseplate assembly protein V